jgi:hypothetical protein
MPDSADKVFIEKGSGFFKGSPSQSDLYLIVLVKIDGDNEGIKYIKYFPLLLRILPLS